jgi:hypothetical protein
MLHRSRNVNAAALVSREILPILQYAMAKMPQCRALKAPLDRLSTRSQAML